MPEPWTIEKRSRVSDKIKKEAVRVAARLGASHVVVVAFFADGDHLHMQDAGNPPMDYATLYKHLATAHQVVTEAGGDVAIS